MGLNKGASGASSVFLITWWKTYSQSLFVGLINAAESFEEYVYLAHGIYIDVYPMNYREQDWICTGRHRLSILVNVFDTQFFHVNNTKAETCYRLCACKVCEFEVIELSARGREKIEKHPQIFLTLMSYAGNAHVYFKHQMLLSSLFLIWEEGNMDVVLDRSTGRT